MITIKINNIEARVQPGTMIVQAAQQLGIEIPTLCYDDRVEHFTSCMLCVVLDKNTNQLIPACSVPVSEGMDIETENERIFQARQDTLELLISEHVGDCEAPCQRICPAYMNIPLMLRQIERQELDQAIRTIKKDIPLPAVLGRICPAPCEKGCNRGQHDEPVSICLLKKYIADHDLAASNPYKPAIKPASGKKVAVIGAGPAGLTAAYYLAQFGHAVTIYDDHDKAGGALMYKVPDERLDKAVLQREIDLVLDLGVKFIAATAINKDISLNELKQNFNAIVLTPGEIDVEVYEKLGFECSKRGLKVNSHTLQTNVEQIFAGGSAVSASKMAVKSVGHGKTIALSIDQYLSEQDIIGRKQKFNSVMGRLQDGEALEFLKEADPREQIQPSDLEFTDEQAIQEAQRCFHCDCRKPESCKLRRYCDEYQANRSKFKLSERHKMQRIVQHDSVIYEPGKCIKCGLCVRLAEKYREPLGLAFINRGFDVKISIPFNESLEKALTEAAREIVEACPTAALSFKNVEEYD